MPDQYASSGSSRIPQGPGTSNGTGTSGTHQQDSSLATTLSRQDVLRLKELQKLHGKRMSDADSTSEELEKVYRAKYPVQTHLGDDEHLALHPQQPGNGSSLVYIYKTLRAPVPQPEPSWLDERPVLAGSPEPMDESTPTPSSRNDRLQQSGQSSTVGSHGGGTSCGNCRAWTQSHGGNSESLCEGIPCGRCTSLSVKCMDEWTVDPSAQQAIIASQKPGSSGGGRRKRK